MNPYPGIRPFLESEADLFFGRDAAVDEVLRRMGPARLLAVAGLSGCGKSSLIRAGIVPALKAGLLQGAGADWLAVVVRPGRDPLRNLAGALLEVATSSAVEILEATLRRSTFGLIETVRQMRLGANLLLAVDPFEEIFRYSTASAEQADEAALFVRLLLAAADNPDSKVYVLIAMRSDFIGDCSSFHDLPEALSDGLYLVPRLTREERRAAIENPAEIAGARFEPALVQSLLNLDEGADTLVILQHALRRTWGQWERAGTQDPIGKALYEEIGNGNAIETQAEETLAALSEPQREIAGKVLRRLTTQEAGGRVYRRAASIAELSAVTGAAEAAIGQALQPFADAGLAIVAGGICDLAHEAVLRRWRRLAAWAREEAESADQYRRLADLAQRYADFRLTGRLLEDSLRWAETVRPNAAWAARYGGDFPGAMKLLERSKAARAPWRRWFGK